MALTTLRAADWQNGDPLSTDEVLEEVERRVVRFLMNSRREGNYVPRAFRLLGELALASQLLIIEREEHGRTDLVACLAYTLAACNCADPLTGVAAARRIIIPRMLCVGDVPDREELAIRLLLEVMLRGTIRSRHDNPDEPLVLGTLGVVLESNRRFLKWAAKLGPRVTIIEPGDARVEAEPVLETLRSFADAKHAALNFDEGYRFAIANRTLLIEAARLNFLGSPSFGRAAAEVPVRYDLSDPYRREIETAVASIARGHRVTHERLGLTGDQNATIWGPPEVAEMRIGVSGGALGWEDFLEGRRGVADSEGLARL